VEINRTKMIHQRLLLKKSILEWMEEIEKILLTFRMTTLWGIILVL